MKKMVKVKYSLNWTDGDKDIFDVEFPSEEKMKIELEDLSRSPVVEKLEIFEIA